MFPAYPLDQVRDGIKEQCPGKEGFNVFNHVVTSVLNCKRHPNNRCIPCESTITGACACLLPRQPSISWWAAPYQRPPFYRSNSSALFLSVSICRRYPHLRLIVMPTVVHFNIRSFLLRFYQLYQNTIGTLRIDESDLGIVSAFSWLFVNQLNTA